MRTPAALGRMRRDPLPGCPAWRGAGPWGIAMALLLCSAVLCSSQTNLPAPPSPTGSAPALQLREVLDSVAGQYPPLLAALVEKSIAEGRLRGAQGTFDPALFARLFGTPRGYYETATAEAGVEQFLGLWGATIYGGYRLTEGDRLPDYYSQRTQGGGDVRLGLRLPLLQDGSIDPRRAALLRARLDRELADPLILRQHLDFLRAGMVAYYQWIAAGRRLEVGEEILRMARERQDAIEQQISRGLTAPIVSRENRQLVVSRELVLVRARRRLEAAALALSLLHRDARHQPVVAARERLPSPSAPPVWTDPEPDAQELTAALDRRPEIRQLELQRQRLEVDLRLARNGLQPRLDAGVEAARTLGGDRYRDLDETQLKVGLEFRMPLGRNQARGAVQESQGRLEQLDRQIGFARDRIVTEIRNAHQAVVAAQEQLERAELNVRLARELQEVERDRFRLGAADLLAVQFREQAAYQAQLEEVDAMEQTFAARADLLTALARDLRANPALPPSP